MVFDCFIFFDELDLLEIRLKILDPVIDYFVFVESNVTFSGKEKSYNFKESELRFKKWMGKIIYFPIQQLAGDFDFQKNLQTFNLNDGAWQMEFQQRNALSKANERIMDTDVILLSDLDEIPDPRVIENISIKKKPEVLQMLFHYYYLNCQRVGHDRLWRGTVICSGEYFKNSTPQLIRNQRSGFTEIDNAGWHFSYLGGLEKIKYKIQSFAHTEYNNEKFLQDEKIMQSITTGTDLFKRTNAVNTFASIFYYPPFLRKIFLDYPHLIYFPKKGKFFSKVKYKILRVLHFFRIYI